MPRGVYKHRKTSVYIRLWNNVKKTHTCWEWTGFKVEKGYGQIQQGRGIGVILVHRLSWIETNGPIPKGMCILHKCDNPCCVRPDHLFLGTKIYNNADMRKKNRHAFGERVGTSKLTKRKVIKIRNEYATGRYFLNDLSKKYKVHISTLSGIINKKLWSHI